MPSLNVATNKRCAVCGMADVPFDKHPRYAICTDANACSVRRQVEVWRGELAEVRWITVEQLGWLLYLHYQEVGNGSTGRNLARQVGV